MSEWLDKAIEQVAPIWAAKRAKARLFTATANTYVGASRSKRSLSAWNPRQGSPDADLSWDLLTLRNRSRDLMRNAPIARGAISTVCTNVIGTGLKMQARVDRDFLGMSDEDADQWEQHVEREWCLFSEREEIDVTRTLTFDELQDVAFRTVLQSGDVFALLAMVPRAGSPYQTKVQLIESDLCSNPSFASDNITLTQGVEKDANTGAPLAYHISNFHPGAMFISAPNRKPAWVRIPAFGATTGRRNVLHLFRVLRPGQSRGEPYLAPVIDTLKQLDRYTEAELMAAVVTGLLTVFIKSDLGDAPLGPMVPTSEIGGNTTDEDIRLGSGAVVGLAPGEDIAAVNPMRPNTAFDPFMMSIMRQIGIGLELPYEILVKHFTASYSAARAALLEAWKFFAGRRTWVANKFCQPVYEAFLWEAVALGRIQAPGFFSDPLTRMAYCGASWIGPAKGMLNEVDEVKAARERIDGGLSTIQEETAQLTGGDWEWNHKQSVKEMKRRMKDGLYTTTYLGAPETVPPQPGQTPPKPVDTAETQ